MDYSRTGGYCKRNGRVKEPDTALDAKAFPLSPQCFRNSARVLLQTRAWHANVTLAAGAHLGAAFTGLILGLGSSPTHEVIQILKEIKLNQNRENR